MQKDNMALLIELSHAHRPDPVAAAVEQATEVGVVVPSLLRSALEKAKLRISDDPKEHEKRGFDPLDKLKRVLIHGQGDTVIAMGASVDVPDSLLHAVLGYLRERDIALLGYIVPLEFHRVDPAKINVVTLNGRKFSDEQVAALKGYLARKAKAQPQPTA